MIMEALQVVLVYYIAMVCDSLTGWQSFTRPIFISPLVGLALGDLKTGIIMGATLESLFMGISAIGGAMAADATSASVIIVAFTILTGSDVETGMGLAMPVGTALISVSGIFTPLWASLAGFWERLAEECNPKKFTLYSFIVFFITPIVNSTVLFLSIAFGVTQLNTLLASLPAWVMSGLGAASGMMIAIGFAILTSMIWDNQVGYFFFGGYVFAAYLGMPTLAIAIIGAIISITLFFSEKRIIDLKNEFANNSSVISSSSNDEEDFF